MSIEIERKYLIVDLNYRNAARPILYRQGYLSTDINRTIRVRIVENKGFITIKSKNENIKRYEFEYEIPLDEAKEIMDIFCGDKVIEKFRYTISYHGDIWEIDEFIGNNKGLIIAEIELKNEDQKVNLPPWIGREISGDPRYFNSNLVKFPFKEWT